VAREFGLDLGRIDDLVMDTARATTTNRSSMLQDLEAGRQTEVGAIYDAVIAAGEQAGIDTPSNRVISALVHAREANTRYEPAGSAAPASNSGASSRPEY
jgi:2-dehydropantoate 2-reductase